MQDLPEKLSIIINQNRGRKRKDLFDYSTQKVNPQVNLTFIAQINSFNS